MTQHWSFLDATREGFTASAITIFQGSRLQATVRETIQNSLDASDESGAPVTVGFSLTRHSLSELPEIGLLKPFVELAKAEDALLLNQASDAAETPESQVFYKNALKSVLSGNEIHLFGIHDSNTSGLGGPTKEEEGVAPGQWLALLKGAGVDVKKAADSLGSFGQGAKAPFALSHLRTVLYLSQPADETELRFQGKTLLSSFWLPNEAGKKTLRSATGYFSANSDQDPLEGALVPQVYKSLRNSFSSGAGTSIFVPAPHGDMTDLENFWRELRIAILLNFYFALENKNLVVRIGDEETIDHSNCAELAKSIGFLSPEFLASLSEDHQDKAQSLVTMLTAAPEMRGIGNHSEFGEYHWAIRVGEGIQGKKVGIARRTGMLITRTAPHFERFPGLINFDLFLCVTGKAGSTYLKKLENPSHDKFEFDRISDLSQQTLVKAKYKKFETEIRELIKSFAALSEVEEHHTSDLNDLLGGGSSEGAEALLVQFPKKLKVGKRGTLIVNPQLESDDENLEDGETGSGGSSGTGGGNSTGGSGAGSGKGAGGKSGRASAAKNLLLTPSGADNFTIYFNSDVKSGKFLYLFESGETSREPVGVFLIKSGTTQTIRRTSLSESDWELVSRGRYKVQVHIPSFTSAIEAVIDNAV